MTSLADDMFIYFDFSLQLYCASIHPLSPEGRGRAGNCIREFDILMKKKVILLVDMIIYVKFPATFCNCTMPVPRPLYQKVRQGPAK